jgi:hypothetical protein
MSFGARHMSTNVEPFAHLLPILAAEHQCANCRTPRFRPRRRITAPAAVDCKSLLELFAGRMDSIFESATATPREESPATKSTSPPSVSYHANTSNGYHLQISRLTHDNRLALPNAVKPKPPGAAHRQGVIDVGYRSSHHPCGVVLGTAVATD